MGINNMVDLFSTTGGPSISRFFIQTSETIRGNPLNSPGIPAMFFGTKGQRLGRGAFAGTTPGRPGRGKVHIRTCWGESVVDTLLIPGDSPYKKPRKMYQV